MEEAPSYQGGRNTHRDIDRQFSRRSTTRSRIVTQNVSFLTVRHFLGWGPIALSTGTTARIDRRRPIVGR